MSVDIRAQDETSLASVKAIYDAAERAKADAQRAQEAADEAEGHAQSALTNAGIAQTQAENATKSANAALGQLGVVEDVVGTLNWIAEHGTYKLTTDTEVVEGKYYFTKSGDNYNVVINPTGNPQSQGYYELDSVDEAVANYVSSHLALTDAGLWVTNDNNSYKILLANDGMKVYDASGNLVSTFGESITFNSARPQTIGNNNTYIKYYDSNNDGVADAIEIAGSNVSIASNVTIGGMPTKVSDLQNDSGYQTSGEVSGAISTATSGMLTEVTTKDQYYLSTASNTPVGGTWQDTMPSWSKNHYIWTRVATTKTNANGTTTTYSDAVYDRALTSANSVANTANTGLTGKADKSSAVASTVSVYYRSTTESTPTISSSTSIGTSATTSNAWEYVMPQPLRNCYFYTCEQYTMVNGDVSFSTVRPLDNATYTSKWCSQTDNAFIDGGAIYANSVTASQIAADTITTNELDVTNINNSGLLTTGALTVGTQNEILNSKIQIGGTNLLLGEAKNYQQTAYRVYQLNLTENLVVGETYTLQFWGVTLDSNSTGLRPYWGGGGNGLVSTSMLPDANGYCSQTFTVGTPITPTDAQNLWLNIYNFPNGHAGISGSIQKWKLEKGNKGTDWSPAPEDVTYISTNSASGAIAHFEDASAYPAIDVTANIEPIQAGSGTPSPSNPRAISGFSSVNAYRTGKNLLEKATGTITKQGLTYTANDDGTVTVSGTATANSYIAISPNTSFSEAVIVSGVPTPVTSGVYMQTVAGGTNYNDTSGNGVTIHANTTITEVRLRINNGVTVNNAVFKPMIRLASETDAAYEQYNSETKTVSLGQTVYGGTLDVVSGVLTVDRAMVTLNGSDTFSAPSSIATNRLRFNSTLLDGKAKANSTATIKSNYAVPWVSGGTDFAGYLGNGTAMLALMVPTSLGIDTTAKLSTYLASNPLQLVYELATPQTLQLTPTQIDLLQGINNVWADSGNISVEYATMNSDMLALADTIPEAAKTATSYITYINPTDGIKVHSANDTTNYAQINSSGMDVVKGGTSVAFYGETARIGKESSTKSLLSERNFAISASDNTQVFNVGISSGSSRIAKTQQFEERYALPNYPATYTLSSTPISGTTIGIAYGWGQQPNMQGLYRSFTAGTASTYNSGSYTIAYNGNASFTATVTASSGALSLYTANFYTSSGSYGCDMTLGSRINKDSDINPDGVVEPNGFNSATFGTGLQAYGTDQTVIGRYNAGDFSNRYAFIIGNGSLSSGGSVNENNALLVDWNGNLYNEGVLTSGGINTSMFSIERHTTPTLTNSGAVTDSTLAITNSGYYPLGVVGWACSGSLVSYLNVFRANVSARNYGSGTITYSHRIIGYSGSSTLSGTITFDVLWLKTIQA